MELSWSTFLLEIVNFAILVWILSHFLYRPLQAVIARRRAGIEQELQAAQSQQQQAEQLRDQYENRLDAWEKERQSAREALQQELAAERTRLVTELHTTLDQAREKALVLQQHQSEALQRQLEQQALTQAARFASLLLRRGATAALEAELHRLLIESLPKLPAEQLSELRERIEPHAQAGEQQNSALPPEPVEVSSAFTLDSAQRKQLSQALESLLQRPVICHFSEDPKLIAGLRVSTGPWVLRANVQDELQGFTEFTHEPG